MASIPLFACIITLKTKYEVLYFLLKMFVGKLQKADDWSVNKCPFNILWFKQEREKKNFKAVLC